MSSSSRNETLLSTTGHEVLETFNTIIYRFWQNPEHQAVDHDAVIEQKERFDRWAMNIGLYQQGHASLDYRFRDAVSLSSFCHDLLEELHSALQDVLTLVVASSGSSVASSLDQALQLNSMEIDRETANRHRNYNEDKHQSEGEDEDEDGDQDELLDDYDDQTIGEAALEAARDCINRLFNLSMIIRDPSRRTGDARGYHHRQMCVIEGAMKVDLYDRFAIEDEKHVRDVLKALNPDEKPAENSLIHRLANANTQRRRQFGFWSQRKLNLSRQSEIAKQRHAIVPQTTTDAAPPPARSTSEHSKAITATELDPNLASQDFNENIRSPGSVISISVSEFTGDHATLKFPDPPERYASNEMLTEFECPYCLTMCPARYLKSRQWKSHLIKDLRPYICTYKDCRTGGQLYDSFTDWMAHEVTTHVHSPSSSLNAPDAFPSDRMIEELGVTHECPFCPRKITVLDAFYRHLAYHLIRIALFALPRSTDIKDDASNSTGSNLSARRQGAIGSQKSRLTLSERLSFKTDPDETSSAVSNLSARNQDKIGSQESPFTLSKRIPPETDPDKTNPAAGLTYRAEVCISNPDERLDGHWVVAFFDPGSKHDIILRSVVEELKLQINTDSQKTLEGLGRQPIRSEGQAILKFTFNGRPDHKIVAMPWIVEDRNLCGENETPPYKIMLGSSVITEHQVLMTDYRKVPRVF